MNPEDFLQWIRRRPYSKPLPKLQSIRRCMELLGVNQSTFYAWLGGSKNPSDTSRNLIDVLVRENRAGLVERAEDFARHRHMGQTRKFTDEPYVNHPEAVAGLVAGYTGDEMVLAAAWLHDTMEDCGASYEELSAEFGPYVAALVFLLTNDEAEKERVGKVRYMCRKLAGLPPDALLIKLCDMLNNMSETRSKRQADTYREILERVRVCRPGAWNGAHEALAVRIMEVYEGKG